MAMARESAGAGPRSLALLGGTFDPVHLGHLILAEQVRERLGLQQVLFVPCGQPPHKPGQAAAPAEDRYAMVAAAICGNPHFAVSRLELERPGPSYTIDTLLALRAQVGPECDIVVILGADQILELPSWRRAREVVAQARFVAVPRAGSDLGQLPARLKGLPARVQVLALPEMPISATDLRARVRDGRSIRYLTPDPVREYIVACGLYRTVPDQGLPEEPIAPS